MLNDDQAERLKAAGPRLLQPQSRYRPEYYGEIISTRTFEDRLDTLAAVRDAGMKVCCGGIVGMNEARSDRVGLLHALATLPRHPESVPINQLVRVPARRWPRRRRSTPSNSCAPSPLARIAMPASVVRLSAGREEMSDELQALCFLAGANSIFYGERLLTTGNPEAEADRRLFERLGLVGLGNTESAAAPAERVCSKQPAHCGSTRLQRTATC